MREKVNCELRRERVRTYFAGIKENIAIVYAMQAGCQGVERNEIQRNKSTSFSVRKNILEDIALSECKYKFSSLGKEGEEKVIC